MSGFHPPEERAGFLKSFGISGGGLSSQVQQFSEEDFSRGFPIEALAGSGIEEADVQADVGRASSAFGGKSNPPCMPPDLVE